MSTNRNPLSSRPVIAVVLVALAAVAALNVRTFGERRRGPDRAAVRVQAAPPFPTDMGEILRASGVVATPHAARSDLPPLARDPFVAAARPASPVATPPTTATGTRRPPRRSGPHCDAVFPGGAHPLAVIDGRPYRVGERVGRRELTAIGIDGVRLRGADGREIHLAVGEAPAATSHGLVTSLAPATPAGRTRLADDERKTP